MSKSDLPRKILFVCLGNICRSPAAEGLFKALCPDVETDSAGTAGYHVGAPPYGPMQVAAQARGVDISALRARQFNTKDFERFDLILAMDRTNQSDIETLRPAGNQTPVKLFTYLIRVDENGDVPDPYYTRDFDGCLDLLSEAAQALRTTYRG